MAEIKDFKSGDEVIIRAANLNGVRAEVVFVTNTNGLIACRIISSDHPSGHSQLGTVVMFTANDLEAADTPKVPEVSL